MGEVEQPHCIIANWKTKRKARRSWLGRKWHGMSQSNFIRLKLLKLGLGLGWEMLTQPNVGLGAILTNLLILIYYVTNTCPMWLGLYMEDVCGSV